MPDYKRLVSYMYNYEDGSKRNNVGYARVETRNGQCKYTIHITAPSLNEKQLKVYLFKRNAEDMDGILLGTLHIRNGVGDFKAITESTNIKKSSYSLDEMGGMVLYYTERKFFATEWDNKPILMSKVYAMDKKELKKTEQSKVEQSNTESKEVIDDKRNLQAATVGAVLSKPEVEDSKAKETKVDEKEVTVKEKEKTENSENANIIFFKEVKDEKQKDNEKDVHNLVEDETLNDLLTPNLKSVMNHVNEAIEEDSLSKKLLENNKEILQNKEEVLPEENSVESQKQEKITETPDTINPIQEERDKVEVSKSIEENEKLGQVQENKELQQEKENVSNLFEDHPIARQFYNSFPKMYPFEDNEIIWCARIEPKDIGLLPTDYWTLGNNSFLLHGYYSYRHLIFARVSDKNGCSYILGVPGIYHNREKFMAKMFGFENFKCTKRKQQRTGEFGYWYIPVILN